PNKPAGLQHLLPLLLAFSWAIECATLAEHFVKHDASSYGDVQRRDRAHHRNLDQHVALAPNEVVKTFAFRAEHDGAVHVVVELIVVLRATLIEADGPDVAFFEVFESAGD